MTSRRSRALVVFALLTCAACSTGGRSLSTPRTEPSVVSTSIDDAELQQRIEQLEAFSPSPALGSNQCWELSISDGSVQIDASGSLLARKLQAATVVAPADLRLQVRFGSGSPSFTCTDSESEVREAVVDETWPAIAAAATFTVVAAESCSLATLQLTDVVAEAPNGARVPLGDLTLVNPAWWFVHPFECHLDGRTG